MSLFRYSIILPLLFGIAHAATPSKTTQTPPNNITQNVSLDAPSPPTPNEKIHMLRITIEELKQNPQLLQQALNTSILMNNTKYVGLLLPLYQKVPNADKILILYAQAILARNRGDYPTSINQYRQIIALHPELNPVRLQLAQTLFDDEQDTAALDQFEKLRSSKLPEAIMNIVNQYINAIQNRNAWQVNGHLRYLQESNVNQGTEQTTYGNWTIDKKPQSAHGISYGFSLNKFQPIIPHWGITPQLNVYGKYYWDNHRYNDLTMRLGMGLAYRSALTEVSLTPFVEREWYSNEPFALRPGINSQFSHWITPRWQALISGEIAHKWQDSYTYLRGNTLYASGSLFYVHSPQQYWLFGIDYYRSHAEYPSDAYHRAGIRTVWGQEWPKGISTQLQFSVGKVHYDGKDIIQILRKDTQYNITGSIWLRNFHFYGLTPRLTIAWQKAKSNHFMYNFHNTQVYIEISKKF